MTDTNPTTTWIKATASNGDGACVEMRRHGSHIQVRDSKQHGEGPILSFTQKEFAAFLDGVDKDEFSHLLD